MAVVEYVEVVDFDDEEGGGEAPAEEAPAEGEQRGTFDRGVWIWYGPKNIFSDSILKEISRILFCKFWMSVFKYLGIIPR